MSNSTQDNNIANNETDLETTFVREGNSTNTKTAAGHQEDNCNTEHLESSAILATERNLETPNDNTETISIVMLSNVDENNVHENNVSNSEKEGILEIVKDIATLFAFFFYLSDIVTDIFVASYYFSTGSYAYGFLILFFVYLVSAFSAAVYSEWDCQCRFCKIFIFNLSGVLLYGEIIYMLYRKWSKKVYKKNILNSRQEALHNTMFVEGLFEGYPQILIQTCILSESIIANEHISWLRYTSVAMSTLAVNFSILRFTFNNLETTTGCTRYDIVTEFLWDYFFTGLCTLIFLVITAATVSSGNIYFIIIPFIVFVFIFILLISTSFVKFISKRCFSRNLTAREKRYIVIVIVIILTTICWYFTRNAVLWYWPLTFNFINYLSILYFVLGLVVIILKVVQIILCICKE